MLNVILTASLGNLVNHTGNIDLAELDRMRVSPVLKVPWRNCWTIYSILSLGTERTASCVEPSGHKETRLAL